MMNKRVLVVVSVVVIAVASIGGYALAQGSNIGILNNDNGVTQTEGQNRNFSNHCGDNERMLAIMDENGFEDMAKWMKEGDFEAMDEFMNNLSEEDYQRMIAIMDEQGYGNMSSMMRSIGREGMINMHNSMMGSNGSKSNMMGNMMNRY